MRFSPGAIRRCARRRLAPSGIQGHVFRARLGGIGAGPRRGDPASPARRGGWLGRRRRTRVDLRRANEPREDGGDERARYRRKGSNPGSTRRHRARIDPRGHRRRGILRRIGVSRRAGRALGGRGHPDTPGSMGRRRCRDARDAQAVRAGIRQPVVQAGHRWTQVKGAGGGAGIQARCGDGRAMGSLEGASSAREEVG